MEGYTLLEKLGQGGMGVVYRALQVALKREVALKVLPASAVRDEEARRRFLRECQVIAALSHPNIVRVYDFGEHDGQLFFTMELVRGRNLVAAAPLSFVEAAPLFAQAADALAFLHARGIWHRDVKPANLVLEGGRLVLLDFGLVTTRDSTQLTEDGSLVGTMRFIPPEVLRGAPSEAAADVYALAVTAQEALTGEPAFAGVTPQALLGEIVRGEVLPLAQRAAVPEWFLALHRRALSLDAAARPSAAEYRDALKAGARGSGAKPTPGRVPLPQLDLDRTARRRLPGWSGLAAAVGFILVALAVLAAAFRARGPERPGRAPIVTSGVPSSSPPATMHNVPATPSPPRSTRFTDLERSVRIARSLALWPTEHAVLVDFDVPDTDDLVLEVGSWFDRAVQTDRTLAVDRGFVQVEMAGLPSDADLFLRVRRVAGGVLLPDYRFRTRSDRHAHAVQEALRALLSHPSDGGEVAGFFQEYPDPRAVPALVPVAQVDRPDGLYGYSRIAMVARKMRNAVLARALYKQRPGIHGSSLLTDVLAAAVWARVPEAVQESLAATATTTSPHAIELAARAAELTGGVVACDALAHAIERVRCTARVGYALSAVDAPRALEHAKRWLAPGQDDALHVAALHVLAERADDPAIALLRADLERPPPPPTLEPSLCKLRAGDMPGWAALPTAADALSGIDRPAARLALAQALYAHPDDAGLVIAVARAGDASLVPALERALARPGTPPRLRREIVSAAASIGGPAARPLLSRLLADRDTDVSAAAAWGLSREAAPITTSGTVNVSVPAGATLVRTGVHLAPGDSVEISATGSWGRAGGEVGRVEASYEVDPALPPLGLTALIGTTRWRVMRRPARLLASQAGELVLSPWQLRPAPAALLKRPAVVGQAYVVIVR